MNGTWKWEGSVNDRSRTHLIAAWDAAQGEFAMLCFGATRDVEEAKSRLENLTEIVRQSGI